MTHVLHELHEELPELAERITELKTSDAHFAKMADDYHALNRAIHRAETDIEPTDDAHLTDMRKQRLELLDRINAVLHRTDLTSV